MIKYFILLLVGCSRPESKDYTDWGRELIDCPDAVTEITSHEYDVATLKITGCGLKICCSHVYNGYSCFGCKVSE